MRNLLSYHFLTLVLLVGLTVTGCAVKASVPVTMPASAGEVLEFRKVAVLDFSTDSGMGNKSGNAYSSAFETEIAGVNLNGKKLFTVLDRQNIDKILKEQKLQMTIADDKSIVELGKIIGVSAIWTGSASENYDLSSWFENETYCATYDNGSCVRYDVNYYKCISQDMALSVTPKLTDVSTGKVIYSTRFNGQSFFSACKYDLSGINRGELWNRAMRDILNRFRKTIAPYIKLIRVEIMTSDKGIEDKKAQTLFKEGIEYMKKNKTGDACSAWREIIGSAPESVSIYYNVAVCDEIKEDYTGAMEKLNMAKKLAVKENKLIDDAIERNLLNIKYQKMVQEQLAK